MNAVGPFSETVNALNSAFQLFFDETLGLMNQLGLHLQKSKKSKQTESGCVGPRPCRGGARDRASPREVTPWVRRMLRVSFAWVAAPCVARGGRA
jgi:hypothetical protein